MQKLLFRYRAANAHPSVLLIPSKAVHTWKLVVAEDKITEVAALAGDCSTDSILVVFWWYFGGMG